MSVKHVDGKSGHNLMLYTLSTCIWCRKTKELLNQLGIGYSYVDVDAEEGAEKQKIVESIKKFNPACSFPTIVVDNSKCIVGFQEEEIRKLLRK